MLGQRHSSSAALPLGAGKSGLGRVCRGEPLPRGRCLPVAPVPLRNRSLILTAAAKRPEDDAPGGLDPSLEVRCYIIGWDLAYVHAVSGGRRTSQFSHLVTAKDRESTPGLLRRWRFPRIRGR